MNPYEELLRQAGWLPNQGGPMPTVRPTGGVDYGAPTPEDQAGVLDMAKRAAASGLGVFQGVMDTFGGRAIKGALAGKPRELLSVLPFSDTLHITDPTQRTSGRELLEHHGLLDRAEPGSGLDLGDVAGVATDFALDPSSYLFGPGAALTKGGQLAKAAGILPPTVRERLGTTLGQALANAPPQATNTVVNAALQRGIGWANPLSDTLKESLGGLVGVGLPFARNPLFVFGQGPRSQALANQLGGIGDAIGQTYPARVAKALFQKKYEGRAGQYEQEILGAAADPTEAGRVAAQAKGLEIDRAMQATGGRTEDVMNMIRPEVEGVLNITGPLAGTPEANALAAAAGAARQMGKDQIARELKAGFPARELENYFPVQMGHLREPTPGYATGSGARGGGVSGMSPHLLPREEIFDVPGGREMVNEMARDAAISGTERTLRQPGRSDLLQEAAHIAQNYAGVTPEQAKGLAGFLSELDPKIAREGLELFPNADPIGALVAREAASHRAASRANAVVNTIAKYAKPDAAAWADWVPASDAMRAANLTGPGADQALANALRSTLGSHPLNDLKVPRELFQELTSLAGIPNAPPAVKGLLNLWDSATTAFKTGVSTIFPKKYIRDFAQDSFRNLGQLGPSGFAEAEGAAKTIVKDGQAWAGANRVPGLEHLSAEAASKQLADEVAARAGTYGPRATRAGEELGAMGERAFREHLPGEEAHSLLDIVTPNASRNTTYNPRDIAGIGGRTETKFAPAVAANKVQELGSDINRTALYIGKRMEGYAPDAAWAEVLKSHYDYGNLTGFEKSVMKRVVPFYNWTRQNLPSSLEELINHPGGLEASVAKGAASLRSNDFVPKTAGDVLAVPLGKNEDGSERYLGRTGLQVEDALKNLGFAASPGEALGDLNPYLKSIIELSSGRQLGTGRRLSELQGITGNPIIDEMLHQGPLARILSTERTAADERKGLGAKAFNLLAPASVTDVNPKTKENALREVVEEKLAHSPNVSAFERYYVAPDKLQNLSPEELMLLRVYQDAEKKAQAANRAKSRPQ